MSQTVEGLADVIAVAARLVEVLATVDDRDARVAAAADASSLLRGLCAEAAAWAPRTRQPRWWDDTEHGSTVIVGGSVWRRDRIAPGWERVGGEGVSVWLDDVWFDRMAAQSGGAA